MCQLLWHFNPGGTYAGEDLEELHHHYVFVLEVSGCITLYWIDCGKSK